MGLDNFREYGALILLFRGCADDRLRQQVLKLVPELAQWESNEPTNPARWVLRALDGSGRALGTKVVVCRPVDLPVHELEFKTQFDLASSVEVSITKISE